MIELIYEMFNDYLHPSRVLPFECAVGTKIDNVMIRMTSNNFFFTFIKFLLSTFGTASLYVYVNI